MIAPGAEEFIVGITNTTPSTNYAVNGGFVNITATWTETVTTLPTDRSFDHVAFGPEVNNSSDLVVGMNDSGTHYQLYTGTTVYDTNVPVLPTVRGDPTMFVTENDTRIFVFANASSAVTIGRIATLQGQAGETDLGMYVEIHDQHTRWNIPAQIQVRDANNMPVTIGGDTVLNPSPSPFAAFTLSGTPSATNSVPKWTSATTMVWSEDDSPSPATVVADNDMGYVTSDLLFDQGYSTFDGAYGSLTGAPAPATTVTNGGTGYVTSDLLFDQGYTTFDGAYTSLTGAPTPATVVENGNTGYVTSDLLFDQGYGTGTTIELYSSTTSYSANDAVRSGTDESPVIGLEQVDANRRLNVSFAELDGDDAQLPGPPAVLLPAGNYWIVHFNTGREFDIVPDVDNRAVYRVRATNAGVNYDFTVSGTDVSRAQFSTQTANGGWFINSTAPSISGTAGPPPFFDNGSGEMLELLNEDDIFVSLSDTNMGNNLSDTRNWRKLGRTVSVNSAGNHLVIDGVATNLAASSNGGGDGTGDVFNDLWIYQNGNAVVNLQVNVFGSNFYISNNNQDATAVSGLADAVQGDEILFNNDVYVIDSNTVSGAGRRITVERTIDTFSLVTGNPVRVRVAPLIVDLPDAPPTPTTTTQYNLQVTTAGVRSWEPDTGGDGITVEQARTAVSFDATVGSDGIADISGISSGATSTETVAVILTRYRFVCCSCYIRSICCSY